MFLTFIFTLAAIASSALAQHNIPNSYVIQQQQNSNQLRMLQDRYYQQQRIKRMEKQSEKDKDEIVENEEGEVFN
tara:strand:- start:788 stop:1012 length:225 start_codon:yes stop_codon:yes gene_type:complete